VYAMQGTSLPKKVNVLWCGARNSCGFADD
jgi:hypothetical protein